MLARKSFHAAASASVQACTVSSRAPMTGAAEPGGDATALASLVMLADTVINAYRGFERSAGAQRPPWYDLVRSDGHRRKSTPAPGTAPARPIRESCTAGRRNVWPRFVPNRTATLVGHTAPVSTR